VFDIELAAQHIEAALQAPPHVAGGEPLPIGPLPLFALLVLPPLGARGGAPSMASFLRRSALVGFLGALTGATLSFGADLPLGASVTLGSACVSLVAALLTSRTNVPRTAHRFQQDEVPEQSRLCTGPLVLPGMQGRSPSDNSSGGLRVINRSHPRTGASRDDRRGAPRDQLGTISRPSTENVRACLLTGPYTSIHTHHWNETASPEI